MGVIRAGALHLTHMEITQGQAQHDFTVSPTMDVAVSEHDLHKECLVSVVTSHSQGLLAGETFWSVSSPHKVLADLDTINLNHYQIWL